MMELDRADDDADVDFMELCGMSINGRYDTIPISRNNEGAHAYIWRNSNSIRNCPVLFRMTPALFHNLHQLLYERYGLRGTSKSSSIEALGMTLWRISSPMSCRATMIQLGRSPDTIHRNFLKVLDCLDRFAADMIRPIDPQFRAIHPRLQQRRFHPYFNGCIGALDGTHVECIVDSDKVVQYMNRKGKTSQNVLAVVDFDMRFIFALAGWPGSAHDSRVLRDATSNPSYKFPTPPPGKYYLVDSGYANTKGFLAPYRGNRYHIPEWRRRRASGMKEHFNHAHSSLRNVVERSFALLKERWRMLKIIPRMPVRRQSKIIFACMGLHNYIIENNADDEQLQRFRGGNRGAGGHGSDASSDDGDESPEEDEADEDMNRFRDQLAYDLYHRTLG